MTRDGTLRRITLLAAAGLVGALLLALGSSESSQAAWPGKPGKIAFKGTSPCCDIWTMNGFGGGFDQLTSNAYSTGDPSWSKDGKRITFRARTPVGINDSDIFVINADGSGEHALTTDNVSEDDEPNFTPNGKRIVFESDRVGPELDIYVMSSADGSGVTPLTKNSDIDESEPAISPNGKLIAYTRDNGPSRQIWVMNADGSGQHALTETAFPVSDYEANFSPDGRTIAFVRYDGSDSEIWVMNADGSGERQVTDNTVEDDTPAFSPNGTRITLDSAVFNPMTLSDDIISMNLQGGDLKQLTIDNPPDDNTTPDWQPIPVKCTSKSSTLVGTPGKDKLVGTKGPDVIAGLGGKDTLIGKGGNDRLCGGAGNDKLVGGKGRDRLHAGGGRDRCTGGAGHDLVASCERSRSI